MFKVQINDDEHEKGVKWLRVTHKDVAWSSIEVRSDQEALQIVYALQQSVHPTAFGVGMLRRFGRLLVEIGRSLSRIGGG